MIDDESEEEMDLGLEYNEPPEGESNNFQRDDSQQRQLEDDRQNYRDSHDWPSPETQIPRDDRYRESEQHWQRYLEHTTTASPLTARPLTIIKPPTPQPSVSASGLAELVRKRRREMEFSTAGTDGSFSKYPRLLSQAGDSTIDRIRALMACNGTELKPPPPRSMAHPSSSVMTTPPASKPSATSSQTASSDSVSHGTLDPRPPLTIPPLNFRPDTRPTFITSLSALSLTREIGKLWPSASFIDRDYSSYDDLTWPVSNSTAHQSQPCSLSFEADISISPQTAIITTTTIALLQKPATPTSLSPLRQRISHIAPCYSRLVVLVSENAPSSTSSCSLTPRELVAHADLVAWTSAHPSSIETIFVAGGMAELARWSIALMNRHADENLAGAHLLIATETSWEVLLRRAGMNIFAAQLVVNAARAVFGERNALDGLLALDRHDRDAVLGGVVGDMAVLERAWAVLKQSWR